MSVICGRSFHQHIFHLVTNANSIVENIAQIKNEIMNNLSKSNLNMSLKIIVLAKKIKNGILA